MAGAMVGADQGHHCHPPEAGVMSPRGKGLWGGACNHHKWANPFHHLHAHPQGQLLLHPHSTLAEHEVVAWRGNSDRHQTQHHLLLWLEQVWWICDVNLSWVYRQSHLPRRTNAHRVSTISFTTMLANGWSIISIYDKIIKSRLQKPTASSSRLLIILQLANNYS